MASTSDRAAAANATRRRLSVGATAGGAPGGVLANVSEGGAPGIAGDAAPILSEWFLKRGKLKKKLKNRLFLLYPDRIEYKKRASGTAQGKIWLSTILEVCVWVCSGGSPRCTWGLTTCLPHYHARTNHTRSHLRTRARRSCDASSHSQLRYSIGPLVRMVGMIPLLAGMASRLRLALRCS